MTNRPTIKYNKTYSMYRPINKELEQVLGSVTSIHTKCSVTKTILSDASFPYKKTYQ